MSKRRTSYRRGSTPASSRRTRSYPRVKSSEIPNVSAMTPDELLAEALWQAAKGIRRAEARAGESDPKKVLASEAVEATDRVLAGLFQDQALRLVLAWAIVAHASRVLETSKLTIPAVSQ
jgi:hypothetical protein